MKPNNLSRVVYLMHDGSMFKVTYDSLCRVREVKIFEPGPPTAGLTCYWRDLNEDTKHAINCAIVNHESSKLHSNKNR